MSGNAWADHLTNTIATLLCAGALNPCGIRSNGKLPIPRCDRETFRSCLPHITPQSHHCPTVIVMMLPVFQLSLKSSSFSWLLSLENRQIISPKSPTRGSEELVEESGQCESPFLQPSPKTTAQLTLVMFYLQVFMRRQGLRGLHPHSLDLLRASPIKEHRQKQVLRNE